MKAVRASSGLKSFLACLETVYPVEVPWVSDLLVPFVLEKLDPNVEELELPVVVDVLEPEFQPTPLPLALDPLVPDERDVVVEVLVPEV